YRSLQRRDRSAAGGQGKGNSSGLSSVAIASGSTPLPRHIAIVMDGNGRWARARGDARADGHRAGVEPVRMVIEECVRHGIGALTLFAFSSENWGRPRNEVMSLMSLFVDSLEAEIHELHELKVAEIDEPTFAAALALGGLPDPDLFIRTGGEQRISNFLLWNLAYT